MPKEGTACGEAMFGGRFLRVTSTVEDWVSNPRSCQSRLRTLLRLLRGTLIGSSWGCRLMGGDPGPRLGRDPMIRCSVTSVMLRRGWWTCVLTCCSVFCLTKDQMRFPVGSTSCSPSRLRVTHRTALRVLMVSSYQSDWVSQRVVQRVAFGWLTGLLNEISTGAVEISDGFLRVPWRDLLCSWTEVSQVKFMLISRVAQRVAFGWFTELLCDFWLFFLLHRLRIQRVVHRAAFGWFIELLRGFLDWSSVRPSDWTLRGFMKRLLEISR